MARIAFVGLGRMGLPMARNLLKADHHVTAFDMSAEPVRQLAAEGGGAAASAAEAVTAGPAEVVITMLPEGRHTLEVYERSGVLQAARAGSLFIDCSSIDLSSAARAHELAAAAGMASLDAPVS